jgi:hypothetical protein
MHVIISVSVVNADYTMQEWTLNFTELQMNTYCEIKTHRKSNKLAQLK